MKTRRRRASTRRYKYYAQRWEPEGNGWAAAPRHQHAGPPVRTWSSGAGERMFLAQDTTYRTVDAMARTSAGSRDYRLSLLRQVTVGGKPAAELLDSRRADRPLPRRRC